MKNDRQFPRTTSANISKNLVDQISPEKNSPLTPTIEYLDKEFGRKVQDKENKACCFDGQAKTNVSMPRQVC